LVARLLGLLKEHIVQRGLLWCPHRLIDDPLINMNGLIALILVLHHLVLLLHIVVVLFLVVILLVLVLVGEDRLLDGEHLLLIVSAWGVMGVGGGFLIWLLAIFVIGHTVGVGRWRLKGRTKLRGGLERRLGGWGQVEV
jgi:hypothetical protein